MDRKTITAGLGAALVAALLAGCPGEAERAPDSMGGGGGAPAGYAGSGEAATDSGQVAGTGGEAGHLGTKARTVAVDQADQVAFDRDGISWVAVAGLAPVPFPDEQMVNVGEANGFDLWANRVQGIGGGGGGGTPALVTGAWHRVYVKTDDGRYVPMAWKK